MNLREMFKRSWAPSSRWLEIMSQERPRATASGEYVDAKNAEGISTVFACVRALSESTATLPLHVFRRGEDGQRERADDHALARVLREPNPYQTGMEFRESLTASVLLEGNGYARKEYNGSGEVAALYPLDARSVSIVKLPSGSLAYDWNDTDGKRVRLLQDEVLHLKDRTDPGAYVGKSRITIARETLGASIAMRNHGANTFAVGGRPAGFLEQQRSFNPTQMKDTIENLNYRSRQLVAGKFLTLPHGMKFTPAALSMEDQQWMEAMQFNVAEVCRIFRVPPILVQELTHATFTNVQELGLQFVRYSLQRWISMWEDEINRSLLGPIARRRYYAEHSVDGLLRSNPELRATYYQTMVAAGVMTVDECRKLENLPPLGGDPKKSLTPD